MEECEVFRSCFGKATELATSLKTAAMRGEHRAVSLAESEGSAAHYPNSAAMIATSATPPTARVAGLSALPVNASEAKC
jgi:hypothetical protein